MVEHHIVSTKSKNSTEHRNRGGVPITIWLLVCLLLAATAAAYNSQLNLSITAMAAIVAASIVQRLSCFPSAPLDWIVCAISVSSIAALLVSQYPSNTIWYAEIVVLSSLAYVCTRIVLRQASIATALAAAIGIGGAILATIALFQFTANYAGLHAAGFHNIVSFRGRLITPKDYILGEWLTVLLSTLPFAAYIGWALWNRGRRTLAAIWLTVPTLIAFASILSCSRAVFWSLVLFTLLAPLFAATYGLARIRSAFTAVGVLAVILTTASIFFPGVLEAYTGTHASQSRSTEGRLAIWKRSADVFKQYPLLGVGAGNSPLFLNAGSGQDDTTGFASRTFSLPIQILTENGLIGAALYAAIFCLAGWEAHRRRDLLGCCLFAGLVAVLARELTYSSLLENPITAMLAAINLGMLCRSDG